MVYLTLSRANIKLKSFNIFLLLKEGTLSQIKVVDRKTGDELKASFTLNIMLAITLPLLYIHGMLTFY